MELKLSINCGFAINRYVEPEAWGQIVGEELGLHSVQFVADLLNPFLPEDYVDSQIKRIIEAGKRYDFSVDSIFTSAFTRVNHLMHPDEEMRKIYLEWFKKLLIIGSKLGAKTGGSHFGILTFDTINNPDKKKRVVEAGIKGWQELSYFAKEIGYEALIFEPMSVPREFANTVAETKELMSAVNANCGVPMKVCLDIGHAPHPDERDAYPWILALGADSPVVHLQQTVFNKSNHWPFTPEYNEQGYITAERVIECLEKSGCEKTLLTFELSHREHWDTDGNVIADHKASVDYWRQFVSL
ncbi:MAG: putative D-erythrulose-phosphate dehydrogenase protein [Clostridia bacterium]|jgi:sugar phosphate isomerase/epimerase|nr:putative D-erythrulose-phosphate dehydrogenase protein [Clostridia bacterium]